MLKAYTYQPRELGLQGWPEGILRLQGTEPVGEPDRADVYIVPPALMFLQRRQDVLGLPYLRGNEERHVFFDVSDFDQVYNLPCMFIRCNLKKHMREADPNSISWAWPVDDLGEISGPAPIGFSYDVSFHGWISTVTRRQAADSCLSSSLKCDMICRDEFHGYVHRDNRPEADKRYLAYKQSLQQSRLSLCGQSIPGVFPYRFFEAMSAARVPILFCSNYNLPWESKIDYESCAILCKAEEAPHAASIAQAFLATHNDDKILEMGRRGRLYWKTFLNREDWPQTMTQAVKEKFKELNLSVR